MNIIICLLSLLSSICLWLHNHPWLGVYAYMSCQWLSRPLMYIPVSYSVIIIWYIISIYIYIYIYISYTDDVIQRRPQVHNFDILTLSWPQVWYSNIADTTSFTLNWVFKVVPSCTLSRTTNVTRCHDISRTVEERRCYKNNCQDRVYCDRRPLSLISLNQNGCKS